jgi:hypothetical protein
VTPCGTIPATVADDEGTIQDDLLDGLRSHTITLREFLEQREQREKEDETDAYAADERRSHLRLIHGGLEQQQ